MDNLVEQLVKVKKGTRYYVNLLLIIFIAVMIPTTLVILAEITERAYLIYIAFFLLLFCIYGAWYFITSLSIEYEYNVLGSVLRADKIIAKRRRKNVVKADVKTFEDLFKYSEEKMNAHKFAKIYYVGSKEYSTDNYVAVYTTEARGKCAVVFTPNEKTLNALRPYLDREIVKQVF